MSVPHGVIVDVIPAVVRVVTVVVDVNMKVCRCDYACGCDCGFGCGCGFLL